VSDGYTILSLDDVEPVPYHARGGEKLLGIDRLLGFRAAGVNGWTGDPGETLVPEHVEDAEEELYVVVRGRAMFTIDGAAVDAPAGTLLHVAGPEVRTAVSEEPGTVVVAVGGVPGEAHVPSGWTGWVAADAMRRDGRVDDGRRIIREMVERHPGAWHAPYNAACYEALAGEAGAAFELLARARQLDAESVRRQAADDVDLESLHEDARWREVVG
jgi:quercetin dioxygenase-like cupin family protein